MNIYLIHQEGSLGRPRLEDACEQRALQPYCLHCLSWGISAARVAQCQGSSDSHLSSGILSRSGETAPRRGGWHTVLPRLLPCRSRYLGH